MPSTILSDNGVSSGTAGVKTSGSNDGILELQTTTAGGTATTAVTIDTSQNVGIGTTSPNISAGASGSQALTVSASASARNALIELKGTRTSADQVSSYIRSFSNSGATPGVDLQFYRGTTDTDGFLTISTSGSERARITSGGYFKASSTGSYIGSTGAYHEFRTDNSGLFVSTANASQTSDNIISRSARGANSAYRFFSGESSDGGDLEFNLRGDGNGYADGTWNNNGADYAEFFESANGEALTLGATVVLDGNKVREATDQDSATSIIGVVRPKEPSKASMVVGNTAWNKWANKYLTDDFDRYIMEDHDVVEWEETITDEEGKTSTKQHSYESNNIPAGITVPADATIKTHDDKGNKFQHYKLNPAWDKEAEYVNRENRPEWNIIGMLGQVKILKGQPVSDRWIKMRDVSAIVEEWMIR